MSKSAVAQVHVREQPHGQEPEQEGRPGVAGLHAPLHAAGVVGRSVQSCKKVRPYDQWSCNICVPWVKSLPNFTLLLPKYAELLLTYICWGQLRYFFVNFVKGKEKKF